MSLRKIFCHRKREVKAACCIALVSSMLLTTGFTSNRNVKINADGQTIEVNTRYTTPELILNQAGIQMNAKDEYHLSKQDATQEEITIYRATPITIEYQGRQRRVYTSRATVGDALGEFGYSRNAYRTDLDMETKIQPNLNIKVWDLAPAPTEPEEEHQEYALADDAYNASDVGAAELPSYSYGFDASSVDASSLDLGDAEELFMEATAYLPTDGSPEGLTASGMAAQRGVVAVDPDVIPLGTRLYIPGYGTAIAADVGGAIIGNRIDLCMETYDEAMDFGRRNIQVFILP